MSDENNSAAPPELSTTPNAETPQPDESLQFDDNGSDAAEEFEEIEADGEKLRVPKGSKWRDRFLMQSDYTAKTQALANERRQAEEAVRAQAQQVQRDAAVLGHRRELVGLELQLEKYSAVTPDQWRQFRAVDPDKAGDAWMEYQTLDKQVRTLRENLTLEDQRRHSEAQQANARRLEQAEAVYKRDIPNWSPQRADELAHFAVKELGASYEQLKGVIAVPWLVKALHKAALHDQLAKQAKTPTPTTEARPARTITGGTARSTVDPDKLPMKDWMKWQDAEDRKKRERAKH